MDEETRTLSFAHKEGQRAYCHMRLNDPRLVSVRNPFGRGSMEAWAWELGWREQEFVDAHPR